MKFSRLVLVSTIALLSAAPALAQTPMPAPLDDPLSDRSVKRLDKMEKVVRELRSIVFQGRDSGKPVVVQPAETDAQIEALTTRISDLEAALQRVNGQNETLTHMLDMANRANTEGVADRKVLMTRLDTLQKQIDDLKAAQAAPPPQADGGDQAGPPPAPSGGDPNAAFARAKQMLLDGRFSEAGAAFQAYVDRYGDSPKGPEAYYWLGETRYSQEDWGGAATAYIGAIRGWPQTSWAPDAVTKLSLSLIALKKPADACRTLGELANRYPKASAAIKARADAARARAKCSA